MSSSSAHPAAGTNGDSHVVFALSEFEMQRFFPAVNLPGMHWFDTTGASPESWQQALLTHRPRVVVAGWSTPTLPSSTLSRRGGPIRYLCQVTGSVRHVITREHLADGLLVSNWGALVAPIVAEHALLLLLAGLRNLGAWRDYMLKPASGQRKASLQTRTLFGKRIALHGFGAIARNLVTLLRPFRVSITGYSEGVPPEDFATLGVAQAGSLRELCREADALVCCEALTPATRGALNAEVLASLPPDAVFVNVGRGAIADEAALVEAARTRGLRIASDVFAAEPLPHESPLFTAPGSVLSPHIGGPTHDFFGECGRYALANINRFLSGGTPDSLIDAAVYDRST